MGLVTPCNQKRCLICPQMLKGDRYKFNCGFVYIVNEDQLSCNTTDVIYVLRCTTCHAEYIGETKNLRHRISKHCSDTRLGKQECRAQEHLVKCGENLLDVRTRFNIFLLERESDTAIRKAKESYFIRLFLPRMNK